MKVQAEKTDIQKALTLLASVVDSQTARVDEWGSAVCSFSPEAMRLEGTDGSMFLRVSVPCQATGTDEAEYCISLNSLMAVVGTLAIGALTMRVAGNRLHLTQNSARLSVPIIADRVVPAWPDLPEKVISCKVPSGALSEGMRRVGGVMQGGRVDFGTITYRDVVRITIGEDQKSLHYMATDGNRLAWTMNNLFTPVESDGLEPGGASLLVYRKCAVALRKFCNSAENELGMWITDASGLFVSGDNLLHIPNASFEYPDASVFLDAQPGCVFITKREVFEQAIQQVCSVFDADERSRRVEFQVKVTGEQAGSCIVSTTGERGAIAEVQMPIDLTGSHVTHDFAFSVNGPFVAYALDTLDVFDSVMLKQDAGNELAPVHIHGLADEVIRHVIMPINMPVQQPRNRAIETTHDKDTRTPVDNVDDVNPAGKLKTVEKEEVEA